MGDTALAGRLRIAAGSRVWVNRSDHAGRLGTLPDGATLVDGLPGADVAIAFTPDAAAVASLLDGHARELAGVAVVWVAYPKGNAADINRDTLWPILAGHGFRPIGQVAIDATWSALRFRPLKPGEAQFTGGGRA
jgi:hypothetical protein